MPPPRCRAPTPRMRGRPWRSAVGSSRLGRRRAARPPRCAARNAPGLTPTSRWKKRPKLVGSGKPSRRPISATGSSVSREQPRRLQRHPVVHDLLRAAPGHARLARVSVRTEQPSRAAYSSTRRVCGVRARARGRNRGTSGLVRSAGPVAPAAARSAAAGRRVGDAAGGAARVPARCRSQSTASWLTSLITASSSSPASCQ